MTALDGLPTQGFVPFGNSCRLISSASSYISSSSSRDGYNPEKEMIALPRSARATAYVNQASYIPLGLEMRAMRFKSVDGDVR